MKKISFILFFLVAFLSVANAKIIFGVIPLTDKDIMQKRFAPFAKYLTQELGEKVVLKIGKDYDEIQDGIMNGKIDLAYLGPIGAAKVLQKNRWIMPLVKLKKGNFTKYRGMILARKDSSIKTLKDFKGKKFAFGDPSSTISTFVPRYYLRIAGVKLTDLKKYYYTGTHGNVIKAILSGKVDGGGVKEDLGKEAVATGKIKLIEYTFYIPTFTICANSKKFSRKKISQVKKVLLKFGTKESGLGFAV